MLINLHKTLRCVYAICKKFEILTYCGSSRNIARSLFPRYASTTPFLEVNNFELSQDKVSTYENVVIMPRNRKTKVGIVKHEASLKVKKKKAIKKKKRQKCQVVKEKSVVSHLFSEHAESDGSDIVIIFDSREDKLKQAKDSKIDELKQAKEQIVRADNDEESDSDSDDLEDMNNMGNVNSEKMFADRGVQNSYRPGNWRNSVPFEDVSSYRYSQSVYSQFSSTSQYCGSQWKYQNTDSPERMRLRAMRPWEYTKFGSKLAGKVKSSSSALLFTLLSYNVLAQDLLHNHPHLYYRHEQEALTWKHRSNLLLREIKEENADIICFQEVQSSHLNTFYYKLRDLGYVGIYKQRTGENIDGVAIYFKKNLFDLVDHVSVEYYQPNISVLDRHNVGLIAKLAVREKPDKQIVVATTHLLFNPRRHDVKLAQIQILLAEVERFAFKNFSFGEAEYWPVMITGDMNFVPHTGVYKFLTEGVFRYEGLSSKTLTEDAPGPILGKQFLPKRLNILDTCQHWGIMSKRLIEQMDHKNELKFLKIHNTDHQLILRQLNMSREIPNSFEEFVKDVKLDGVNNFVTGFGPSSISPMPEGGFGTGQLTHNLNLHSVYTHNIDSYPLVTTQQGSWVTVDYIFYSHKRKAKEGNLKLVAKRKLLTPDEAGAMGPIPNRASPSDHYPLVATFYLKL